MEIHEDEVDGVHGATSAKLTRRPAEQGQEYEVTYHVEHVDVHEQGPDVLHNSMRQVRAEGVCRR